MVHLIVMTEGTAPQLNKAESLFAQHDMGWQRIEPGVWLLATNVSESDWRDFLRAQVGAPNLLVARLKGAWATQGVQQVADWLRSANGSF